MNVRYRSMEGRSVSKILISCALAMSSHPCYLQTAVPQWHLDCESGVGDVRKLISIEPSAFHDTCSPRVPP